MEIKKNLVLMSLVICSAIFLTSCGNENINGGKNMVSEFEQKIKKELPIGTPKDEIEQYLNTNKIEHSWVEEEKNFRAIVRNVEVDGIVSKSISIAISLDDSLKLNNIRIEPVFTGP